MQFSPLALDGITLVEGPIRADPRGAFMETWRADYFDDAGLPNIWLQDNLSVSVQPYTIRGLHWQIPPFAQAKLVRVLAGEIVDVVVDLRTSSPTFGRSLSVPLSAAKNQSLLVPAGFAHGFCTIVPNTMVAYKTGARYAPECERALRWDCPDAAIDWPLNGQQPILSEKDALAKVLKELSHGDFF
jgi:dTDP-4-dehydrorhamnose 3,5-epimerase